MSHFSISPLFSDDGLILIASYVISHGLTLVMVPSTDNHSFVDISKTISAEDGLRIRKYLQLVG